LTKAKFVLVHTGDESIAYASKAAGEIDECLSIECPENELFATVQRLIDYDQPTAGSAGNSTNREVPARPARNKARSGLAPGALRRVREFIEQHFTRKFDTEDLAAVAGLSPGHFNRAFKQSTGSSPHRYVMGRRIAVATELLQKTSRALADIALDVGFADQSQFSRAYVAVTGETPSACRRRHR